MIWGCLLWVACDFVQPEQKNFFQPIDLGKTVNVSCFHIEPNGSMWMGLDGQGLAYKVSATAVPRFYNKLSGTLPSDIVLCCYQDSQDRLWFGTFGNGIFYWDGKDFQQPKGELSTEESAYVAAFLEDTKGSIWIATQKAGIVCLDTTGQVRWFNKDNSALPTNWLSDMKTSDRQTFYVATGWGLFVLNTADEQIAPLTDSQGKPFLEKQLIRILHADDDGMLWIGTENGLYAYQIASRTYRHLTTDDGLGDNYVKAIAQDHKGNIWVTGDHSATCIAAKDFSCQSFRLPEGMTEATFHVRAIGQLPDGRMVFGTSKGILSVNPSALMTIVPAPKWPEYMIVAVVVFLMSVTFLIYKRKRDRRRSTRTYAEVEPSKMAITPIDEQLKEKAIRVVEEHADDTEFSVEQLADVLGMSRGHLYKRLLSITGKTPIEFIRTIRIKQGKQLLEQSGESVSQVAWRVGMSPKQFSKYFKEEFGMLPSEYQHKKPPQQKL